MVLTMPQQVIEALDTTVQLAVYIDGLLTDVERVSIQHGVKQPVATATLSMVLPRPQRERWVASGDGYGLDPYGEGPFGGSSLVWEELIKPNSTVEIQAGHSGYVGTVFSGRIPSWASAISQQGNILTVKCVGWASYLTYRERWELEYDGPVKVQELFDSLCARRNVPQYRADRVLDTTGTIDVVLGDNPYVDDGIVTVAASSNPLTFLGTITEPFGYAVYDTPDGTVRLSRTSGKPTGAPVARFVEGVSLISASREYDIANVVNYHDVHGATYEDEVGASIPIRSLPATVMASPYVPVNRGVAYGSYSNNLLTTQQLADIVRNVMEIDKGAPEAPVKWQSVGVPGIAPGDVVEVDSPTIEASGLYWVTAMDTTIDNNGYTTTWTGWAGGGEALPAGVDRVMMKLQEAPFHIGDEYVGWYAVPSPGGGHKRWSVIIPKRATAVNIYLWHHGTNSQLSGGTSSELQVTRWRVFGDDQDPDDDAEKPVASGNMPIDPERYEERLPYSRFTYDPLTWDVSDSGHWSRAAVNLSRLEPGTYTFEIVSGKTPFGDIDDMEGRLVMLEIFGTAEPVVVPGEVL